MAEVKDDPREVLGLLNSLGFVGITAPQLKAFMKDLKMHRKVKERERQQWKEETKRKILNRQQMLYKEVLREHKKEMGLNVTESTVSSESSSCQDESSYDMVKVKIKCIPKDKENQTEGTSRCESGKYMYNKTHGSWANELRQNSQKHGTDINRDSTTSIEEPQHRMKHSKCQGISRAGDSTMNSMKYISMEKPKPRVVISDQSQTKYMSLPAAKSTVQARPASAQYHTEQSVSARPRSVASDRTENSAPNPPPPSRSSARSRSKSFIRPWRLQPEVLKAAANKKSDPVALYQKYQEEWKQLALPGEEHHAGVRWAVREKMLGLDPNPRPVLKKSSSMMAMKKR